MIYAVVAGVALALLAAVIALASRSGRAAAERDFARTGNEHAKKGAEIDETVAGLDDSALDSELRDGEH